MLSIKRLTPDPWQNIKDKFKIGDVVKGKIIKLNPFGFFVEIGKDIHGLAHISELGEGVKSPEEIGKPGESMDFKIVAFDPDNHKLNLSLKALKEPTKTE